MKKVLITGVTGQDGSHMCDYLLKSTNHLIYGAVRRLSVSNHDNIAHILKNPRFHLVDMDLNDSHSITDTIIEHQPDYFLNFAAQSFVAGSWKYPIQTWETDSDAVLHILESIRRFSPHCRFYNAGSSEEFGDINYSPQNELHPLNPQSPYGAAKCAARHIVRVYRESYGLYAVQSWLFNHEGTRRGLDFVTRKITHNIAKLKFAIENNNKIPVLSLGNIEAKRDWSDAEDLIPAVWLMLHQDQPKNYVLGSGKMHSVREFLNYAFNYFDISYNIHGKGSDEKFYLPSGDLIFEVNPDFYRPAEVHKLCADISLVSQELNWKPKSTLKSLVEKMCSHDYELISRNNRCI